MFNKLKNIFKNDKSQEYKDKRNEINVEETPEQNEDEYIWVEGYKGTNADMSCVYYTFGEASHRQQYELNKIITCDGEPVICENGFHFCIFLQDVFQYYPLSIEAPKRYFKVKALVKKKDYDNRGSKLAAKEILFLEEISLNYNFLKENKVNYIDIGSHPLTVKYYLSENEYKDCFVDKKYDSSTEFLKSYIGKIMKSGGFSETFINFLFNKKSLWELVDMIPLIESLVHEGVSKDLAFYILYKY